MSKTPMMIPIIPPKKNPSITAMAVDKLCFKSGTRWEMREEKISVGAGKVNVGISITFTNNCQNNNMLNIIRTESNFVFSKNFIP